MPVYRYQAINSNQLLVKGTIAADTPRQARERLRDRGLRVRAIDPARRRQRGRGWLRRGPQRYAAVWAMAVHELSMLLAAGIPLLEALDTLLEQHRGTFRAALLEVRERVAAGAGLAEALRQRGDVFDELSVNLVEVGEQSGELERILRQLAQFKQRQLQWKDQVANALAYPAFLVVFGTAATLFLMTYVMPPMLENLQETLTRLPWPTRVVKSISDLLLNYGLMLVAGLLGLLVAAVLAWRSESVRRRVHRTVLRLPAVGKLVLKQNLARVAMVLSTLLRSGMVLTRSLQLAAGATGNLVLREALQASQQRVAEGKDVGEALQRSGVFPPLAVQIFSVGQDTGRLEEMLDQLTEDYQQQVRTAAARMASLLEPVLIVVLAVFVGFVLVATILPILEAGNVL